MGGTQPPPHTRTAESRRERGESNPFLDMFGKQPMQSYPLKMGGLSVVSSGPVGTGLAVFLAEQATRARRHNNEASDVFGE